MSSDKKVAISVKGITKTFRIPLDKGVGVKAKVLGRATRGYREFTPLNDITFDVYEGDFFGIVGRNGSGKSTLLKTIAGIYEPTAGRVKVNGTLVPFIELGVGFNPNLTGRENVYLNAALLGFSREETDGMYDDIVDFAELHDFMEERLQNYSSGMQVRLAFSISIRAKGDILLLDEVLAVGDTAFQQKCFDYFDQLKADKKTVILVTHSMSNVERFCNRGLLLNNGEIDTIGSSDEVAEKYRELFDKKQPNEKKSGTSNIAAPGIAELRKVVVAQEGVVKKAIEPFKPFTVRVDIALLNRDYGRHNLSVRIRNKRDVTVAFMNTVGITGEMFDTAGEAMSIEFTVKDNIYSDGEYYIDILLKSLNRSLVGTSREIILNEKQAAKFSITGNEKAITGVISTPTSQVTISDK